MYSDEDIANAVKNGVLTQESAQAFQEYIAQLRHTPAVDEERFRLVTGFNDIFVVIACVLLLISVNLIGDSFAPWMGALISVFVSWLLAEFFTRQRRMALPSIVLLLAFVGSAFATGYFLKDKPDLILASTFAALAAWVHWKRFKVPITVSAGTAAALASVIAILLALFPGAKGYVVPIMFGSGVIVFCLAMYWDSLDKLRQTRKSDVAFWLHLLASPLLVHSVFSTLGIFDGQIAWFQALVVMGLYVLIAFVSLAIDRRALMVSALGYVIYAFSTILETYGVVSLNFALTAFGIGSALLLLSAFWHPCRKFALRLFPQAIQIHLAPLR